MLCYERTPSRKAKLAEIRCLSIEELKEIDPERINVQNGPKILKEIIKHLQGCQCVGCACEYTPWKGHNGWCGQCSF